MPHTLEFTPDIAAWPDPPCQIPVPVPIPVPITPAIPVPVPIPVPVGPENDWDWDRDWDWEMDRHTDSAMKPAPCSRDWRIGRKSASYHTHSSSAIEFRGLRDSGSVPRTSLVPGEPGSSFWKPEVARSTSMCLSTRFH